MSSCGLLLDLIFQDTIFDPACHCRVEKESWLYIDSNSTYDWVWETVWYANATTSDKVDQVRQECVEVAKSYEFEKGRCICED